MQTVIRTINPYRLFLLLLLAALIPWMSAEAAVPNGQVFVLNHSVVDAAYSKQLDRIVTVSHNPKPQLHVIDPATGKDLAVNLPYYPKTLSIGPEGTRAVVGHSGTGAICIINLNRPALVKTYPASSWFSQITLGGTGYAYDFISQNYSINLAKGLEVKSPGNFGNSRLHPGGKWIYSANTHWIDKFDISGGPAVHMYAGGGGYRADGNLWISEDGAYIFSRSGNIFRCSDEKSLDMTYAGSLSGIAPILQVGHSVSANMVLAIPDMSYPAVNSDDEVWKYDYNSLECTTKIKLPAFPVSGKTYASHGRFVFFNSTGDKFFVVVRADPSASVQLDSGIVSYAANPEPLTQNISASSGSGGRIFPSGSRTVKSGNSLIFNIVPDEGFEIADVRVDGVSIGKTSSYRFDNVSAGHTIRAAFKQCGGDVCAAPVKLLNHRIIDAAYHSHADKIVTVSSTPTNQLHLYDPATKEDIALDLPYQPVEQSLISSFGLRSV